MPVRTPVEYLPTDRWAVIDLDSGTVLGTNVVLVPLAATEDEWLEILDSDSAARDYGLKHGHTLYAHVRDDREES